VVRGARRKRPGVVLAKAGLSPTYRPAPAGCGRRGGDVSEKGGSGHPLPFGHQSSRDGLALPHGSEEFESSMLFEVAGGGPVRFSAGYRRG
jgi:hypothetical protein